MRDYAIKRKINEEKKIEWVFHRLREKRILCIIVYNCQRSKDELVNLTHQKKLRKNLKKIHLSLEYSKLLS